MADQTEGPKAQTEPVAHGDPGAPAELPFWQRATPAERAAAFRRWAETCPPVPPLPDEAFRRENWYD